MAIIMRNGLAANFDPNKMRAGELAVVTDARELHATFAPGDSPKVLLDGEAVPNPETAGTNGQILSINEDGDPEWGDVGAPTDEQVEEAVSDWLDEHPEATTTVQDGAITYAKLDSNLKGTVDDVGELKSDIEYITEDSENLISDRLFTDNYFSFIDKRNYGKVTVTANASTAYSCAQTDAILSGILIPGATYRLSVNVETISGTSVPAVAIIGVEGNTNGIYASIRDFSENGDGSIDFVATEFNQRVSLFPSLGVANSTTVAFGNISLRRVNGNAVDSVSRKDLNLLLDTSFVKTGNLVDYSALSKCGLTYNDGVLAGTATQFHTLLGQNTGGIVDLNDQEENTVYDIRFAARVVSETSLTNSGLMLVVLYTDNTQEQVYCNNAWTNFIKRRIVTNGEKTVSRIYLSFSNGGDVKWEVRDIMVHAGIADHYGPEYVSLASEFTSIADVEPSYGASKSYNVGDLIFISDAKCIYKVISNIAIYGSIIEGVNVTRTTIEAELKNNAKNIEATTIYDEASGPIASFNDGANSIPMKSIIAQITPVQSGSGDPSPTNVRPISGWNGCKVTRTGKNLLNMAVRPSSTANGITSQIYENNRITISGTSTGNGDSRIYSNGGLLLFRANQAYTISFNGTDTRNSYLGIYFHRYNVGGYTSPFTMPETAHSKEFMFTEDTLVDSILLRISSGGTITLDATVQIEYGSTPSSFEPYSGQIVEVTFPSEAETDGTVYGGTLDVTTGELTVTYEKKHLSPDVGTWNQITLHVYSGPLSGAVNDSGISDKFRSVRKTYVTYVEGDSEVYTERFCFYAPVDTLDEAKEYINSMGGVDVVFRKRTPLVYHLTPAQVTTLLGENHVFANTGNVAVEYPCDTKLYIQRLTAPDDDMVADNGITSGSYFMVGNNLYLASANIAAGETIVPGTNCTATNLAEALNAINA